MAERTRKLLLPRIKQNRINSKLQLSPRKSLKSLAHKKSSSILTKEMKGDYLSQLIDEDYILADRFNNKHRSRTMDVEDVFSPNSHRKLKNPFNGMQRDKVRSNNTLPHKERGKTPSLASQISKIHILTQGEIDLAQQQKNKSIINESVQNFVADISRGNQVLQRTSVIIIKSLLKLGSIIQYMPRQLIYAQRQPVRRIGLILWGQAVLKKRKNNERLNCQPGYAIGQQLIFERKEYNQKMAKIEKGEFLTVQKCKACSSCGVLFIEGEQYGLMRQQLIRQGYKDIISKFQSLLFRTYIKKRQFRKAH